MEYKLSEMGPFAAMLTGARFVLTGARAVVTRPHLWGYLLAPITILLTFFLLAVPVSWASVGWLMNEIFTPKPGTNFLVLWLWATVGLLVRSAALLGLGLALYFAAGLVATPFNDRLSDQIEQMTLGSHKEPFAWKVMLGDLLNSVAHTALSLCVWLFVMSLALLLNLLPVLGSVLSFLLATSATAIFLGRESMDGCMSRRRMSYRHKYRVVLANLPLVFGFGLAASALLWIPFLNFLMLPVAVAGGTLMYCDLERQGLVPSAK